MKANENSFLLRQFAIARVAELHRGFLALDCVERVGKGKGDFSNGKDINKSCKK